MECLRFRGEVRALGGSSSRESLRIRGERPVPPRDSGTMARGSRFDSFPGKARAPLHAEPAPFLACDATWAVGPHASIYVWRRRKFVFADDEPGAGSLNREDSGTSFKPSCPTCAMPTRRPAGYDAKGPGGSPRFKSGAPRPRETPVKHRGFRPGFLLSCSAQSPGNRAGIGRYPALRREPVYGGEPAWLHPKRETPDSGACLPSWW